VFAIAASRDGIVELGTAYLRSSRSHPICDRRARVRQRKAAASTGASRLKRL
jgi:hypothetical protein